MKEKMFIINRAYQGDSFGLIKVDQRYLTLSQFNRELEILEFKNTRSFIV